MSQEPQIEKCPTVRELNRSFDQIRPLTFEVDYTRYALSSVLAKMGHTVALVTVSLDPNVPSWLKGKGKGWITAEYNLLPGSTHTRVKRERDKLSGRTHEIQRLVSRALRQAVPLELLAEHVLLVDCDILQADGGTRTLCINAASVALEIALRRLNQKSFFPQPVHSQIISAVSLGLIEDSVRVDLDYLEDSNAQVDANFVQNSHGEWIELQATAEQKGLKAQDWLAMLTKADAALAVIREKQLKTIAAF